MSNKLKNLERLSGIAGIQVPLFSYIDDLKVNEPNSFLDPESLSVPYPLALRFVMPGEDGEVSAHAGAGTTVLNIANKDSAVEVLAKFATFPAVIVQQYIASVFSGVVFTSLENNKGSIEYSETAEGVTAGIGQLASVSFNLDNTYLKSDGEKIPEILLPLIEQVRLITADYQTSLDIEWVYDGQQFWIVQARNVTAPIDINLIDKFNLDISSISSPNSRFAILQTPDLAEASSHLTQLSFSVLEQANQHFARSLSLSERLVVDIPSYVLLLNHLYDCVSVGRKLKRMLLSSLIVPVASIVIWRRLLKEDYGRSLIVNQVHNESLEDAVNHYCYTFTQLARLQIKLAVVESRLQVLNDRYQLEGGTIVSVDNQHPQWSVISHYTSGVETANNIELSLAAADAVDSPALQIDSPDQLYQCDASQLKKQTDLIISSFDAALYEVAGKQLAQLLGVRDVVRLNWLRARQELAEHIVINYPEYAWHLDCDELAQAEILKEQALVKKSYYMTSGRLPIKDKIKLKPSLQLPEVLINRSTKYQSNTVVTKVLSNGFAKGLGVMLSDDSYKNLEDTDDFILLTNSYAPAIINGPIVPSGIVTTRGGRLSHVSIVAREYGIPVVLVDQLPESGQLIMVNAIDHQNAFISLETDVVQ